MKKFLIGAATIFGMVWLLWPNASSPTAEVPSSSATNPPLPVAKKKPDPFIQDMKAEDDPSKLFQNASDATEVVSLNETNDSEKPIAFHESVHSFVDQLNVRVQGGPRVHFQPIKNKGEFNNIPVDLWQLASELSNHDDGVDTVLWFLAKPSGHEFYSAKIMEIGGSQSSAKNAIEQMVNDEDALYKSVVNDPSNLVAFVNQVRISDGQPSSVEKSRRIVLDLLSQAREAIRAGDETRNMTTRDHGLAFACLIGNVGGFTLHKSVIAIKVTKIHAITEGNLRD